MLFVSMSCTHDCTFASCLMPLTPIVPMPCALMLLFCATLHPYIVPSCHCFTPMSCTLMSLYCTLVPMYCTFSLFAHLCPCHVLMSCELVSLSCTFHPLDPCVHVLNPHTLHTLTSSFCTLISKSCALLPFVPMYSCLIPFVPLYPCLAPMSCVLSPFVPLCIYPKSSVFSFFGGKRA